MSREEQVEKLTAYMANFIGYTAKVLPDDVIAWMSWQKGKMAFCRK